MVGHASDKVTVSVKEIELLAGLRIQDEDTTSSDVPCGQVSAVGAISDAL
jgi:hypothetical protein